MDAWSDEQLKKMQLGGNARLNEFLGKCGVPKATAVPEKYNSKGAEVRARRQVRRACCRAPVARARDQHLHDWHVAQT